MEFEGFKVDEMEIYLYLVDIFEHLEDGKKKKSVKNTIDNFSKLSQRELSKRFVRYLSYFNRRNNNLKFYG